MITYFAMYNAEFQRWRLFCIDLHQSTFLRNHLTSSMIDRLQARSKATANKICIFQYKCTTNLFFTLLGRMYAQKLIFVEEFSYSIDHFCEHQLPYIEAHWFEAAFKKKRSCKENMSKAYNMKLKINVDWSITNVLIYERKYTAIFLKGTSGLYIAQRSYLTKDVLVGVNVIKIKSQVLA